MSVRSLAPMASRLPTELLIQILSHYSSWDTTSMKRLSLVCRPWGIAAQSMLFHTVQLSSGRDALFDRFSLLINGAGETSVAAYVRRLEVQIFDPGDGRAESLFIKALGILSKLRGLQQLEFHIPNGLPYSDSFAHMTFQSNPLLQCIEIGHLYMLPRTYDPDPAYHRCRWISDVFRAATSSHIETVTLHVSFESVDEVDIDAFPWDDIAHYLTCMADSPQVPTFNVWVSCDTRTVDPKRTVRLSKVVRTRLRVLREGDVKELKTFGLLG